jgi:hypothetical protein
VKVNHNITIVESGVRWARNILAELTNNYAEQLTPARRDALRAAVRALGDFEMGPVEEAHPAVVHARDRLERLRALPGHTFADGPCKVCDNRMRCMLKEAK